MERHIRRHTRAQKEEKPAGKWFTAIVVLVSLVLIGVMIWLSPLGPMIKEYVIEPVSAMIRGDKQDADIVSALKTQDELANSPSPSSTPNATPDPIRKSVTTVYATPFYILQMGNYLDQTAAKEHANQIMDMGAAGVIYLDGAVYRVFAAAYSDEESLMKVQTQVRADGFEATPYITERDAVKITLEGVDSAIQKAEEAIACLETVPDTLCRLSLSYDKGNVSESNVLEQINALYEQCKSILVAFQTDTNGEMLEPVLTVIQKYADRISTFLQERDTIDANKLAIALKRLQIETIIDYIRFFDRK